MTLNEVFIISTPLRQNTLPASHRAHYWYWSVRTQTEKTQGTHQEIKFYLIQSIQSSSEKHLQQAGGAVKSRTSKTCIIISWGMLSPELGTCFPRSSSHTEGVDWFTSKPRVCLICIFILLSTEQPLMYVPVSHWDARCPAGRRCCSSWGRMHWAPELHWFSLLHWYFNTFITCTHVTSEFHSFNTRRTKERLIQTPERSRNFRTFNTSLDIII